MDSPASKDVPNDANSPSTPTSKLSALRSLALSTTFMLNLERTDTMVTIGRLKLRGQADDLPQDWWFASTAIPLIAATIGPLANVLSIAALVSKWRITLPDNGLGPDDLGVDIPDPKWEVILNAISLAMGFMGNICLLFNFTRRIRYIIALPLTILSWYAATAILIAIILAMNIHDAPIRPEQTYSQGFWYAIIAATLYLIGSMVLMINMAGYFLGHYPQHFDLDDDQRTLILQTMMFFFWLAGGAAVFSKVCGFSYANALYFCDVTVLTIGFGDIVATNDPGRGLIFPYSVIGIIFLGLMIKSIRKFGVGMSKDKVIRKHANTIRTRTIGRTVTNEKELRDRLGLPPRKKCEERRPSNVRKPSDTNMMSDRRGSLEQYGHFSKHGHTLTFHENKAKHSGHGGGRGGAGWPMKALSRDAKLQQRKDQHDPNRKRADRRQKLIILREEKDRFNAMREIEAKTKKFKGYFSLSMSVLAFGILWCVGAVVFFIAEKRLQNMTYFQSLYFCYVSLLTIGYGDLSPRSNAGKPFFVVWSLVAIPTMTILVSDMGETVIAAINRGTFTLADWTVMPKAGIWADFLNSHPKLRDWLTDYTKKREAKKRLENGFELQDPEAQNNDDDEQNLRPTLEKIADEPLQITEHALARRLALAIKKTATDLHAPRPKKYSYEEWVEFTRLIRFSKFTEEELELEEEDEGLVEWDWIGEDSPMLAEEGESEWILDRLCESLNRYTRKQARHRNYHPNDEPSSATSTLVNQTPRHRFAPTMSLVIREPYPAHPGHRFPQQRPHPGLFASSPDLDDEDVKEDQERNLGTSRSGSTESATVVGKNDNDDE